MDNLTLTLNSYFVLSLSFLLSLSPFFSWFIMNTHLMILMMTCVLLLEELVAMTPEDCIHNGGI